ncbi:hypothetical protein [Modestobacter sp. NPDC049651]|uniref:hypothetical protein n=1 Tax=unclassified Modestobacter TaxID=2643866 RepID=UPI003402D65F
MRATSSQQRAGRPVDDPHGGRWLVRRWPVAVLPVPPDPPDAARLRPLLAAPPRAPAPAAGAPAGTRPAASWVLGRSARWHGPAAPGADDDPARDALPLLRAVALLPAVPLLVPRLLVGLVVRVLEVRRHSPARRAAPWLVELSDGWRTATWAVRGPDAAAAGEAHVAAAVRAGTLPAPPGARLVEVRDDRPPAGCVTPSAP